MDKKIKEIKNKSIKTKEFDIEEKKEKVSKLNRKRIATLIRLCIVLIPTFFSIYIVGIHSSYWIKPFIKWISFGLGILVIIGLFYLIYKYLKNKEDRTKGFLKWVWNALVYIYAVACIVVLVLLYGPDYSFKDWLITTSLGTMHHKYICHIFYNDNEIKKTEDRNYIIEPEEETDTTQVDFEILDPELVTDENAFEKQILDREDGQEYKILRFKVNGEQAYLAVIYDASRIHVGYTRYLNKNGEYVVSMAKRMKAIIATNGGGFRDPDHKSNGATPTGVTISYGKVITDRDYPKEQGVIGFDNNNVLVLYKGKKAQTLLKLGVRDCVTRGPFLIVNGKSAITRGNGGWGYAARTAIGQRKDGIVLLLVVDSNITRTNGASMRDLTKIFETYGAYNAAALDGGNSSVMVENGELISVPVNSAGKTKTRPVATSIIFK